MLGAFHQASAVPFGSTINQNPHPIADKEGFVHPILCAARMYREAQSTRPPKRTILPGAHPTATHGGWRTAILKSLKGGSWSRRSPNPNHTHHGPATSLPASARVSAPHKSPRKTGRQACFLEATGEDIALKAPDYSQSKSGRGGDKATLPEDLLRVRGIAYTSAYNLDCKMSNGR